MRNIFVDGIKAFISASQTMCVWCGKAKQYDGLNPLGLCSSCFDAVPWIRSIECPVCGRAAACPDCAGTERRSLEMNRSAVRYDEAMKELLARYKYRGDESLQELLGRMLVHAFRLYPPELSRSFDCITYVPLSTDRYTERGFNQAEQMAVVLAKHLKLPVASLLMRMRHTSKQSIKSRRERLDNMSEAFAVVPGRGAKIQAALGKRRLRIIIVDDIYTTGSTLNQCAMEIKRTLPGTEVYGLCWAR